MTMRKASLAAVLKSFFRSLNNDRRGIVVSGEDAEVDRLVVVQDADLGVERGGLALVRLVLQEAGGDRRLRQAGSSSAPSSVMGPLARVATSSGRGGRCRNPGRRSGRVRPAR